MFKEAQRAMSTDQSRVEESEFVCIQWSTKDKGQETVVFSSTNLQALEDDQQSRPLHEIFLKKPAVAGKGSSLGRCNEEDCRFSVDQVASAVMYALRHLKNSSVSSICRGFYRSFGTAMRWKTHIGQALSGSGLLDTCTYSNIPENGRYSLEGR